MKKILITIKHIFGILGLVVGIFVVMPIILFGGFAIIAIISENNLPPYLAIFLPAIFVSLSFGLIILIFLRKYIKLSLLIKNNRSMSMGFIALLCIASLGTYYFIKSNNSMMFDSSSTSFNSTLLSPPPQVIADEVFNLTNKERESLKLKPLVKNVKLEEAALERAKIIIETQDWSHEAGKSGVTYQKAIANSKYYNSVKGENLAKDQTTSAQVVQQWMGSPTHRANIVDPKYQEMGIATFSGKFGGQDTIVTVQLFGGYVPPNYTKEVISSWENSLTSIQGVLPSWENTRNSPNLYPSNKEKCERMITILQTRISKIQQVIAQMKANKWLSAELDKYTTSGDTALYNEQLTLASYLNSQKW